MNTKRNHAETVVDFIAAKRREQEHQKLVERCAALTGAAVTLLRSAEKYGAEDHKHMLAIAEMRAALGIAIDDLTPLLMASIRQTDKREVSVTQIPRPADVVNTCSCGAVHVRESWPTLPYVGEQEDDEEGPIELRNCRCGSTRAVPVRVLKGGG